MQGLDGDDVTSNVSDLLRALWRKRSYTLAGIVANGSREHREIAHAATLISEDYHDRFLVELIQNANDQALLACKHDSIVVVVRSEDFVAVSNGGQAVTARNLERISSLADSDKTGVLVGNKGVGFKAVYQVTDCPEVYSAPDDDPMASVLDRLAVGFALERRPFNDPTVYQAVESDLSAFFTENEGLARVLANAGHEDPTQAVLPELKEVAGFKFPVGRGAEDLESRLTALQFPEDLRSTVRTLVVLRLRDDEARRATERVVDALVGEGADGRAQAELAVLFLSGVARIEVADHVRSRRWSFSCEPLAGGADLPRVTVVATGSDGTERQSRYWITNANVFDCDRQVAQARRKQVDHALQHFGLEAWSADDPLFVTVALPQPTPGEIGPLGPSGRFCLGLPTEQSTGLPAHIDARFFAKINRDGVNFDQREGYNGLLLDVATEVFGQLLARLRASESLDTRRAATLALHRPDGEPGVFAERVYAEGGVADGAVILSWDGLHFRKRSECVLPSEQERGLLPLLDAALARTHEGTGSLPERNLVMHAWNGLVSMGIGKLGGTTPHPWLSREGGERSIVEKAAGLHRAYDNVWWERFVEALLNAFTHEVEDLKTQRWVPTGAEDLSRPQDYVFLPAPAVLSADDEEVTDVPPRVAATLRLVDASKLRLREDGRALTPLATRLADAKLVRRPRKTELLEDVLFPALIVAVREDNESLALDLFAQAVAWIASMKEPSRKKLETGDALVPVGIDEHVRWVRPSEAYLGSGWGLDAEHDRLLATAYPDQRVIPLSALTSRIRWPAEAGEEAAARVAETLGLATKPRFLTLPVNDHNPLVSFGGRLTLRETPTSDYPGVAPFLSDYFCFLCRAGTTAKYRVLHGVGNIRWIDGLEREASRKPILDLMLAHPDHYVAHATTCLRRHTGHVEHPVVPQLWAHALSGLAWPLVPVERGAGGEATRVPASDAWLLADGSRRTAFAKLVNVVPQRLAAAWPLLQQLGVWTVENAPVRRLVCGLHSLASRLEQEHLDVHRDALSLARELYSQIEERADDAVTAFPGAILLPLLRHGRLVAVSPNVEDSTILFDDDPGRAKHIPGAASAYRVPVGRDAKIDKLYSMFVATWGVERVIRASASAVDLGFKAALDPRQPFLAWLRGAFPHAEVAIELAVLLTLGGDRTFRVERISRNWRLFRDLEIVFGSFDSPDVKSFYDRPRSLLLLSSSLKDDSPGVVAATWELAGGRARDLWDGYARALRESVTSAFLCDREITPVEIGDVADAAGLHRSQGIEGVECALLASFVHLRLGKDLNDAAAWWGRMEHSSQVIANALRRPDLAAEIDRAVALPQPEGEVYLVRTIGVPWSVWQAAVVRRDGRIFRFERTVARFRDALAHLVAVVRELAARAGKADLDAIEAVLDAALQQQVPDRLAGVPPEDADADREALNTLLTRLEAYDKLHGELLRLPQPPWGRELPVPDEGATKRGVRLYRDQPAASREVEARSTVEAVLAVGAALAPSLGEHIDPKVAAAVPAVARLTTGSWANVYAALAALREVLAKAAPLTTVRLTEARAFHEPTRAEPLMARLPGFAQERPAKPPPKRPVLGVELTDTELRDDLAAGSAGSLGTKLAEAATRGLPTGLLGALRTPLPEPLTRDSTGKNCGNRGGGGTGGKPTREPELVGDLGEAFVHEWLTLALGEHYGPDCWRSKARERYGLPASGVDSLGYDFEVTDPAGKLFQQSPSRVLIEVKSTGTDGSGPFPMSWGEWDKARRCHEAQDGSLYVIVRVCLADTHPCISDVLIDPFAAHRRGEVRLAERDLWVKVAPPQPKAEGPTNDGDGLILDG